MLHASTILVHTLAHAYSFEERDSLAAISPASAIIRRENIILFKNPLAVAPFPLPRLPRLPLVRFGVLERPPAGPLVGARLAADAAVAASEQDAPQAHGGQRGAAGDAQGERGHVCLGPHPVHVEGGGRVVQRRHRQRRQRVRRLWVIGIRRRATGGWKIAVKSVCVCFARSNWESSFVATQGAERRRGSAYGNSGGRTTARNR